MYNYLFIFLWQNVVPLKILPNRVYEYIGRRHTKTKNYD